MDEQRIKKKSSNNGIWQVFTSKFGWHFVHCCRPFEQIKWNIQRNNRLANVNMDFFDGIPNKSENCVKREKKKLLLMSLFYSLSKTTLLQSLVNWRVPFNFGIFQPFFSYFSTPRNDVTYTHTRSFFIAVFSSLYRQIKSAKKLLKRQKIKKKTSHWNSVILFFFYQHFDRFNKLSRHGCFLLVHFD